MLQESADTCFVLFVCFVLISQKSWFKISKLFVKNRIFRDGASTRVYSLTYDEVALAVVGSSGLSAQNGGSPWTPDSSRGYSAGVLRFELGNGLWMSAL